MKSIENRLGGSTVISATTYGYDPRGRRTTATQADSSLWHYDYNQRDEVIAGKHFGSDWRPLPGQQFEYGYDNLGNRDWARNGGDANGANLRRGRSWRMTPQVRR